MIVRVLVIVVMLGFGGTGQLEQPVDRGAASQASLDPGAQPRGGQQLATALGRQRRLVGDQPELLVDGRLGDAHALGLGHGVQHQVAAHALLGERAGLLAQLLHGLAHDAGVRVHGDLALALHVFLELPHHLIDLLIDERGRRLDRRLGHHLAHHVIHVGVHGLLAGLLQHGVAQHGAHLIDRLEAAQGAGEIVVDRGDGLVIQPEQLDVQRERLAGVLGRDVVGGELHADVLGLARAHPDHLGGEAGDRQVGALVRVQPVLPALLVHQRLVLDGRQDAQRRHIARLGRAILHRLPGGLLILHALQDRVDLLLPDIRDPRRDPQRAILAEHRLRADIDLRGEGHGVLGIEILGLGGFHIRAAQRLQLVILERLRVGVVHADIGGLGHDRLGADRPLEHRARRLARAEAGDTVAAGQTMVCLVHGPAERLGIDLDPQRYLALRKLLNINPHGH